METNICFQLVSALMYGIPLPVRSFRIDISFPRYNKMPLKRGEKKVLERRLRDREMKGFIMYVREEEEGREGVKREKSGPLERSVYHEMKAGL